MSADRARLRARLADALSLAVLCALLYGIWGLARIFAGHVKEFDLLTTDIVRDRMSQLKPWAWKAPRMTVALVVMLGGMLGVVVATWAAAVRAGLRARR
jgi:hypothetical protein